MMGGVGGGRATAVGGIVACTAPHVLVWSQFEFNVHGWKRGA